MKTAWIISIGTELTLGQTVDTNGAWLAQRLAALGIQTDRHVAVADDLAATADVALAAAGAAEVVLITGGLGPTDDDLTRAALARAAGVELVFDETSLAHIRGFFAARGREMLERNRTQAMLPRGAKAILNTCGTAPGVELRLRGCPCYVMPGVPFEMRAMFERDIEPVLRVAAAGRALRQRRLHLFGMPESEVGDVLADLMVRGRNPEVGTTATLGIIGVRINAAGDSAAEADVLLDETEREVRQRIGTPVFGRDEDTLAGVVGRMLVGRGATVSTAESCTGGLIAKELTDVAGSSAYFLGGAVTYSNAAKTAVLGVDEELIAAHGAVSEPVAAAMASGARARFGSDYAVSTTGIAGPGGGTAQKPVGLVYIGLATPTDTVVLERRFGGSVPREAIREWAARTALNRLRTWLLEG
ncbi:MAG: competence/damage-inducible protein A [Phycisphaerae bacterium]|nr:competence/damage-inducible protein A [Phycisphaerae bacterium]